MRSCKESCIWRCCVPITHQPRISPMMKTTKGVVSPPFLSKAVQSAGVTHVCPSLCPRDDDDHARVLSAMRRQRKTPRDDDSSAGRLLPVGFDCPYYTLTLRSSVPSPARSC